MKGRGRCRTGVLLLRHERAELLAEALPRGALVPAGEQREGDRPEPAEAGEGPPLLPVGRPAFALDPLQDADRLEELPGFPHLARRDRPRRDGGRAVGLAASGRRDGR